ncbi:hypothetical protein H0B56_00220 [Haloechinothrix sp. YIM 98757]|uniref:Uncharacterized protein n=1 Tax=Haloechinothrix aidingensis TaxID=2752311 RepID=A0A838A5I9_9PSEU|nr:hypothetical protein [Haloechinothrix aidingensis]MBA0123965.1 hypothetical protein [Haloechinothrix aidingensis]
MYIDESGGTDEVATSEDMTVTVDGEEYTAEMNLDSSGDGEYDTVLVREEDGARAFVDTDGSGSADEYVELDSQGRTVSVAAYDESSGEWVAVDPGTQGPAADETQTGTDGPMTAEFPDGRIEVGPATVDTDHDGEPDTAVVEEADGTAYYFTDSTGDGQADVAVVVAPDGSSTVLEHTGDGQWIEVGESQAPGTASGSAEPAASPAAGEAAGSGASGMTTVDPATGQWITR